MSSMNNSPKKISEQRKIQQLVELQQHPAQWIFATMLLVGSLILLSQLGEQAKFPASKPFVSQPGFWPAISLSGMTFFAACFLYSSWKNRAPDGTASAASEVLAWFKVIEYPLWFLTYVWVVPLAGYLLSSLIFPVLMCWRLGYRDKRFYGIALIVSFSVVVIFKSLLEVKIPGGEIYNYLPEALRNFMIINL